MQRLLATACLLFFASASSSVMAAPDAGISLSDLQNLDQNNISIEKAVWGDPDGDEGLRYSAMREAALSAGAQNGYLSHTQTLKDAIEGQAGYLDDIFDFASLMKLATDTDAELFLLPPVIEESHGVISVSDNNKQIKISGKVYRIHREERLVSAPPNWREYLVFDEGADISPPHHAVLPKTKKEKQVWAKSVSEGWKAGVLQAEREMLSRVRLLGRDYIGTIRYMELVLAGKVTKPTVATAHQDVIGGGDVMREDEKLYQLTAPAQLDPNPDNWRPLPLDTRESLRYPIEEAK